MSTRLRLFSLVALMALLVPAALAQQNTLRSFDEFLAAQGTSPSNSTLFVPPVSNFWGWLDGKTSTAVSVDYSGLANRCFNNEFNTRIDGSVVEKALPNGTAEITLLMHSKNVLIWAIANASTADDFKYKPTIFGQRWDINAQCGAWTGPKNYALGDSFIQAKFILPYPGAPFPDLQEVLGWGGPWSEFSFHAQAQTRDATGATVSITVVETYNVVRKNWQAALVNITKRK